MEKIVETERLYLRRFTIEDAELVLLLNSNVEVLKYLDEPPLQDIPHAEKILNDMIFPQYKLGLGRWAVFIKESDTFIGWCGLKYRPELDEIDLGYRYIPQYWGKGYAYEAAKAALDYGFTGLKLKTIIGRAHVDNTASLHILQKLNMQYLGEEFIDDCPVKVFSIQSPN